LAVVAGALLGVAVAAPAAAEPANPDASTDHVIVVGVAGLRWEDVTAERTPTLAALAESGSVGSLSVRSAPGVTCSGEGWLTLGAGTYAAMEDPADTKPSRGCDPRKPPPVEERGSGAFLPTMPLLERVNHALRFGAQPGLLGGSVRCGAAIGPGAALAVAEPSGRVVEYAPRMPDDPTPLLARCPVSAVDLGALPEQGRDEALATFDAALRKIDQSRPARSVLIVAGIAEAGANEARLHVAVAAGDGFRGGWLRSPSTRRTPYVQLSDLAPTAMALLGEDVPESMAGRPLTGGGSGRPRDYIPALADTDTAAVGQRDALGPFFAGLGVASLVVYGGLFFLLKRRRTTNPRTLKAWGVAALGLAAVPAATFVANLVPWWRSPLPALALGATVLGVCAAIVALAYAGPWRRWIAGPVVVVCAVTTVVVLVDGVTGATLQINSMLGYNPLVAGRFVGFGNIAFAAFGAAVMLLAGLLAYGRQRAAALGVVLGIALPTVLVDGLPNWGADFGGVLTFVPAFAVLAMLVARARISAGRLLLALGAGVGLVALIGIVDYFRPVEARSHFGRFVASVLDGSASATVYRKILTSLDLLFTGPHTVAALALVVWLGWLVFRPPATLREAYEQIVPLRTALIGVVVLSAIGFATNDSSVAVPIVAGMVALPATFALCAAAAARTRRDVAGTGGSTGADTPVPEVARPTEVLP
jgi:hypothetical protein